MINKMTRFFLLAVWCACVSCALGAPQDPAETIRAAGISGGLVVQVGSDDLSLQSLGERFHVRWLLPDNASTAKAQAADLAFPRLQRVTGGVIYRDGANLRNTLSLSDGTKVVVPEIGDMLRRGHHVRCFPGKATERFLITPMRGAEFIDLSGAGEHMVNDWLRGACSLGQMPANGLFYV